MAFTAITTNEITVGEPTTNATWTKVKDNLDDLDSRVTNLDLTVAQPPIIMRVNGSYINYITTGVLKTTLNFNLTITGVFLLIDTAGASGTTEIDLKFSRSGGAYTSIFLTKPASPYTSGNDSINTTGGTTADLHPTYKILQAGDILRLDITNAQSATARNFMVRIDYLKS